MKNKMLEMKLKNALRKRKGYNAADECKAQIAEKKDEFQKEVDGVGKGVDDYLSTIERK